MMELQFRQHFRVIDRAQVDADQETLAVRCCDDCACPTTAGTAHQAKGGSLPGPKDFLIRADDLHFESLPEGHWAVFNPVGNMGVVVVNDAVRSLLDEFASPTTSTFVLMKYDNDDLTATAISRLLALELLFPVGRRPQPVFTANDELVVWLHISNQCNLACIYCYIQQSNEHMSLATGRAAVDAVVLAALAVGYSTIKLKYSGGEASLALDRVFALHDYALQICKSHHLKLSAVLLSNGLGLLGKNLAGIRARDIRVMISLDGLDDAHDRQRPLRSGQSTVQKVLEAIQSLQKADISPYLSITVTAQNCTVLHEIVRYAIERDLSFGFNLYRETNSVVKHPELQYSTEQLVIGLRQAFQVIRNLLPRRSMVGTLLDRGHLLSPHTHACGVGQDYIVVDHHGFVSKCHMMMDVSVADVTCGQPLLAIRQSDLEPHNPPITSKTSCTMCRWRYFCTGGCPLATYQAIGRYDGLSPYCPIYQAIYPLAVQLEGLRLLKYAQDENT